MKIVVIGGTGLIGSKLVNNLRELGHEVTAAARSSGVNTLTGEGLDEALKGADVVVDVANSPSFEDQAVMEFFRVSGTNLLKAEARAGVKHHVALSVVGTDRLQASGYFRAKQTQEELVRQSGIPFTIVHATQFFEFVGAIAQGATKGNEVHVSPALIQPMAAEDVAGAMVEAVLAAPINDMTEIAGPEKLGLDKLVGKFLKATNDPRVVVTDREATYFGVELNDESLVAGDSAYLGQLHYDDWLKKQAVPAN